MSVIDMAAKEFHMKPEELLKESLRTYLEKRLSKVEADIFLLAKKYGFTGLKMFLNWTQR